MKRVEILRSRLLLIVAISDKLQSELRINASGAFLKHVPGMVRKEGIRMTTPRDPAPGAFQKYVPRNKQHMKRVSNNHS